VIAGFVTLDSIPLDQNWRRARQSGDVELIEIDEGMCFLGLQAAAWRVPFLPTRAGLGSSVSQHVPALKTVRSPYPDDFRIDSLSTPEEGDELLAMPALFLDAAIVHVNRADRHGNAEIKGPDPFFDSLFLEAAQRRFVSAEEIVEPGSLGQAPSVGIHRLMTDTVIEAPHGAHFTACVPTYERDEAALMAYYKAGGSEESFDAWWDDYEHDFQKSDPS
jgi:glutaconate CoA-transferase subunit A